MKTNNIVIYVLIFKQIEGERINVKGIFVNEKDFIISSIEISKTLIELQKTQEAQMMSGLKLQDIIKVGTVLNEETIKEAVYQLESVYGLSRVSNQENIILIP